MTVHRQKGVNDQTPARPPTLAGSEWEPTAPRGWRVTGYVLRVGHREAAGLASQGLECLVRRQSRSSVLDGKAGVLSSAFCVRRPEAGIQRSGFCVLRYVIWVRRPESCAS